MSLSIFTELTPIQVETVNPLATYQKSKLIECYRDRYNFFLDNQIFKQWITNNLRRLLFGSNVGGYTGYMESILDNIQPHNANDYLEKLIWTINSLQQEATILGGDNNPPILGSNNNTLICFANLDLQACDVLNYSELAKRVIVNYIAKNKIKSVIIQNG